jgi:hypothetical protein
MGQQMHPKIKCQKHNENASECAKKRGSQKERKGRTTLVYSKAMQCKCKRMNERYVERKKPRAQCKEYKGDKEAGPAQIVNK